MKSYNFYLPEELKNDIKIITTIQKKSMAEIFKEYAYTYREQYSHLLQKQSIN